VTSAERWDRGKVAVWSMLASVLVALVVSRLKPKTKVAWGLRRLEVAFCVLIPNKHHQFLRYGQITCELGSNVTDVIRVAWGQRRLEVAFVA
jgi:hypothetical protein